MLSKKKFATITIALFLFAVFSHSLIKAQITSTGLATSVALSDSEAQSGDIICSYSDGNKRCVNDYDTSIYGVITDNPAVSINDPDLQNTKLLARDGVARIRVSAVNGDIREGDFITASTKAGIGQRATKNGFVVGSAIEAFTSTDPETIGVIQVGINIHPESSLTGSRGNLLQFIRSGVSVPVFSPVESLRYLLAVIIVLVSFTLGMIYFGRASRAGIEAVGRNPLAKKVIQFTVLMNIVLTLVIVLVGLGIAYLILIL